MIRDIGVLGEIKPRRGHVTLDRLALAAASSATTLPRGELIRKGGHSKPHRLAARDDRPTHTTATPTKPSADLSAYNGRMPGGRFGKGNPGEPIRARDRVPRAPRFWKELTAKMDAAVVQFDVESQRYLLVNPVTHEPLIGSDGKSIYDPTYDDVAAVATLYGALHPQDAAKFT